MRLAELKMDYKTVVAILVSTLALAEAHYSSLHPLFKYSLFNALFWYLGVPLLTILLVFRESPAHYGFQLGDWKAGLVLTVGSWVGVTLLMWVVARTGAFRAYYAPDVRPLPQLIYESALELFGWEFIFRGFLIFALYRTLGPYALVLQTVPFTIAHFGKPELETLGCILGGVGFGYVAWRTRSFLYPFLIHWQLLVVTILFARGG